jgi:hypothetical protein
MLAASRTAASRKLEFATKACFHFTPASVQGALLSVTQKSERPLTVLRWHALSLTPPTGSVGERRCRISASERRHRKSNA